MVIDRDRFLKLAWGLAGASLPCVALVGGCGGSNMAIVEAPVQVVDVSPKGDAGRSDDSRVAIAEGSPELALSTPSEEDDPELEDQVASLASGERVVNPYVVPLTNCSAADNQKSTRAFQCPTRVPSGPACESFADTRQECGALTRVYNARFAQKAGECLEQRGKSRAICQFDVTTDCLIEALSVVCEDPAAASACKTVSKTCASRPTAKAKAKMTELGCQAAAAALPISRRARFMSCVTESCEIRYCLAEPMYNATSPVPTKPILRTPQPIPVPIPTPPRPPTTAAPKPIPPAPRGSRF